LQASVQRRAHIFIRRRADRTARLSGLQSSRSKVAYRRRTDRPTRRLPGRQKAGPVNYSHISCQDAHCGACEHKRRYRAIHLQEFGCFTAATCLSQKGASRENAARIHKGLLIETSSGFPGHPLRQGVTCADACLHHVVTVDGHTDAICCSSGRRSNIETDEIVPGLQQIRQDGMPRQVMQSLDETHPSPVRCCRFGRDTCSRAQSCFRSAMSPPIVSTLAASPTILRLGPNSIRPEWGPTRRRGQAKRCWNFYRHTADSKRKRPTGLNCKDLTIYAKAASTSH
jgi:hypothetical protein